MPIQGPIFITLLTFFMAGIAPLTACAAGPLAVDVVSLKSGRTLRGAILGRQAEGTVLMAVSREWLRKADPKEFAQQSEQATEQQRRGWQQSQDRLEAMLAEPEISLPLSSFFKQEHKRFEQQLAVPTPPELPFLLLELDGKQVSRLTPAPPDRRKIAQTAWKESLTGVETRSAAELQKELKAIGIDLIGPPPDLSDLLPVREQSEAEWLTRLALVQYTLDGGLDFQGKGNVLVRTSGVPQIPLFLTLPKLLAGEAEALLGDLLNPNPGGAAGPAAGGSSGPGSPGGLPSKPNPEQALKAAIAEVEQEGHTGFRVTWLEMNADRLMVTVRTEFIAKQPDEEWRSIWLHLETADGSVPRPQAEAAILGNQEVKKLLEPLQGLGFDAAVIKAVRFGAAAMTAQKAADGQFFQFRDRYVKRLDGPVLLVPEKQK